MFCKGVVMYKGIEKRDGGSFTSNGESINYKSAYVVKFDETVEGKINERKLKFPVDNKILYDKFSKFRPYTYVLITCDVVLGQSACRLVPIEVEPYNGEEETEEEETE